MADLQFAQEDDLRYVGAQFARYVMEEAMIADREGLSSNKVFAPARVRIATVGTYTSLTPVSARMCWTTTCAELLSPEVQREHQNVDMSRSHLS